MKIFLKLKEYININLLLEIKANDIKQIIEKINNYSHNNKNKDENIKIIKNLKKELLNITSPRKRFKEVESSFI